MRKTYIGREIDTDDITIAVSTVEFINKMDYSVVCVQDKWFIQNILIPVTNWVF